MSANIKKKTLRLLKEIKKKEKENEEIINN